MKFWQVSSKMRVEGSSEIQILINVYGVTTQKTVSCGECLE